MTEALSQIRQQYKPAEVQIIFITEAVQPGKRFFYLKNSNVFRAIKEAFSRIFGEFKNEEEFLTFFKKNGCYVDYLGAEMINGLPPEARQKVRTNGIKPLSEQLTLMKPKVVVTMMKVLEPEVNKAIELSAITSVQYAKAVPFPAHSQTNVDKCIAALVEVLEELLDREIIGNE